MEGGGMGGQMQEAMEQAKRNAERLKVSVVPDSKKPAVRAAGVGSPPGPPDESAGWPPLALRWTEEFAPNPVFATSRERRFVRSRPQNDGICLDLLDGRDADDEADIWLGLDFGTSCVKAVIRDATLKQSYAVPFSDEQQDRYLLPTRVFENRTGFLLESDGTRLEDLKLKLMQGMGDVSGRSLEEATAFLALVIRHCRGWFLSEYAPRYRRHALNWYINVGLPARAYEDASLVERFRKVAWGAAGLASDADAAPITRETAGAWLERWAHAEAGSSTGSVFPVDDVTVVPEIAAQIAGLVESRRWDVLHRPYFVLIDIGAGTVDSAFFAVLNDGGSGRHRFVFYASDVRPYGVINLHRARASWLRRALAAERPVYREAVEYVDRIYKLAYRYPAFPEAVTSYLQGAAFETRPDQGTIDDQFFNDGVLPQVCGCMGSGKATQKLRPEDLQQVPVVVSGGGSRMNFYGRLPEFINRRWRTRWNGSFTVQDEKMTLPKGLEAAGLAAADNDRLSVAYGLSLPGIGTIVRESAIPPLPEPPKWNMGYSFVSKDQV
jgi:hypothetical protein